ncbi:DUF2188 domain-containing protein [Ornithinibacillus sp. 4-3]|uniref:DUF2188 domain-containing protein n=1 Tax=Ornithinibacillus sp. 4-3 TaxID=3231488 RepID=A0AB39HIR0_9BACI
MEWITMPWDMNDYPSSLKNLNKITRKKAIDIANELVSNGYDENRAIPISTSQAKKWHENASDKELEDYKKHGKPTESDTEYTSNPELLDEPELVLPHEDGWAVQSKKAKKAAKVFDKKSEAVTYGRKVANNKGTKLIIYKKDNSVEKVEKLND